MRAELSSSATRAASALVMTVVACALASVSADGRRWLDAPLGLLVTTPVIGIVSLLVARRGATLQAAVAHVGYAAAFVCAASLAWAWPQLLRDSMDSYRHAIRLAPRSQRLPTDLGPDLPFLETIRDRLPRDGRTLVLTESYPFPDLEVILYPLKDGVELTLKVNPSAAVMARLVQRKLDAGEVPAAKIIDGLRASGFYVPWQDLRDAAWRDYLREFDAIVGLNTSLPLEQLEGFDVVLTFDPRRKLVAKRGR